MKKMNFLKIAFTLVLAFVITGAYSQAILTDYDETNATEMYQTVNTSFNLYAYPDANFSPSYDEATNSGYDATARWTWDVGGLDAGVAAPWADDATAIDQNFVEITAPAAAADYTVQVTESNTLGGGCASGTTQSQVVHVIAGPSAVITSSDITTPVNCGDQSAETVQIQFVEAVPVGLAGYAFAVQEVVETIDGLGATITPVSTNAIFVDFQTSGKAQGLISGGGDFLNTSASPNFYYEFTTSALNLVGTARTKYTYTLLEPSDLSTGTDGVVSAISEKSQYLDGVSTFAYSGKSEIVFIVNPAPVTGPIYHIANDYAL